MKSTEKAANTAKPPPSRGRGLKHARLALCGGDRHAAPFAGAWIETRSSASSSSSAGWPPPSRGRGLKHLMRGMNHDQHEPPPDRSTAIRSRSSASAPVAVAVRGVSFARRLVPGSPCAVRDPTEDCVGDDPTARLPGAIREPESAATGSRVQCASAAGAAAQDGTEPLALRLAPPSFDPILVPEKVHEVVTADFSKLNSFKIR